MLGRTRTERIATQLVRHKRMPPIEPFLMFDEESGQESRVGEARSLAATGSHRPSLARAALRRPYPRQEPSAVTPHAGIRAGGGPSVTVKGLPYRDCRR